MNKVQVYKISIIIPCYSVGEDFLNEALESIENQTYKNWEIVLVDDHSPWKEWNSKKLNLIPKEKLKIIHNKENFGLAESRNIGFKNSSGDIILFLDADDKYQSNIFFDYLIEKFKEYSELDILIFGNSTFGYKRNRRPPPPTGFWKILSKNLNGRICR